MNHRPSGKTATRNSRPRATGLTGVVLLALSYALTGYLGLLLAIPPGYATAIWPASGIALAALLIYGSRLWPGIWLGSLLVNVAVSFDASSAAAAVSTLGTAVSVATGASLQALLGVYLIRRVVDVSTGLTRGDEVIQFLTLGGPVSCIVSATWGVTTLWLSGRLAGGEFPFSWVNWWVGDTIGVIIFVPLVFAWLGQPRTLWHWRRLALSLPLGLALVANVFLFMVASDTELERIEAEFHQRATVLADSFDKKLASYTDVLYGIEGFFLASSDVQKDEFRIFVSRTLERVPGIQALSWNPLIADRQRAAFEQAMRRSGVEDFVIRERNDQGELVTAGERPWYVPVHYIEPRTGNETAIGFDVYSNPPRRRALDLARDTGDPVATAPLDLVQDDAQQAAVLVFLPIYGGDEQPAGVDPRRAQLRGFAVGVFRLGDVLSSAVSGIAIADTWVCLADVTDPSAVTVLAVHGNGSGSATIDNTACDDPAADSMTWSSSYEFGGRSWQLYVVPNAQYRTANRSWTAWGVLAGGLSLTALLSIFLLVLTGRMIDERRNVEKADAANRRLTEEIGRREHVEQSLHDANDQLRHQATVDELTGVFNRRYMQDYAQRCDAEMRRYGHRYGIIMVDVDHFKRINDRFGHDVGDRVLREIADLIAQQLRETDCLGRWGGEEFLVVAKASTLEECVDIAQRLRLAVRDLRVERIRRITISLGVALNDGTLSLEEVIKRADEAMYQAKRRGRNRVEMSMDP